MSNNTTTTGSKGNFISEDRFLYSCLEYEEKISQIHLNSKERISWPSLTEDDILEEQSFEELLRSMLGWYNENFPILSQDNILTPKLVSDCVPPLVSLLKDTTYLYSYKNNTPFPLYNFQSDSNHEVWNLFSDIILSIFPKNARLFEKYFHWSHAKEQKTSTQIKNPYKESSSSEESSSKKWSQPKGQRNKHPKSKNFKFRKKDPKKNKEQEILALAECKSAIEEIKLNPDLDYIVLKPQNSYIRRLQHSETSASGLFSLSQGEDKSRAVVIYREKQD